MFRNQEVLSAEETKQVIRRRSRASRWIARGLLAGTVVASLSMAATAAEEGPDIAPVAAAAVATVAAVGERSLATRRMKSLFDRFADANKLSGPGYQKARLRKTADGGLEDAWVADPIAQADPEKSFGLYALSVGQVATGIGTFILARPHLSDIENYPQANDMSMAKLQAMGVTGIALGLGMFIGEDYLMGRRTDSYLSRIDNMVSGIEFEI